MGCSLVEPLMWWSELYTWLTCTIKVFDTGTNNNAFFWGASLCTVSSYDLFHFHSTFRYCMHGSSIQIGSRGSCSTYKTFILLPCAVATYCCSSSGVHMDDAVHITPGSMDGSMEGKPSLVNTQLGATWVDNLTLQIHTYQTGGCDFLIQQSKWVH